MFHLIRPIVQHANSPSANGNGASSTWQPLTPLVLNDVSQLVYNQRAGFLARVNADVAKINQAIERYNSADSDEGKLAILCDIYQLKLDMEDNYYPDDIANCSAFVERFHLQLFAELKDRFSSLGITEFPNISKPGFTPADLASDSRSSLAKIVTNMDPIKLNIFMIILSSGANFDVNELASLYHANSPGEAGKHQEFADFLSTHSIAFLGGNNSRNFVVTDQAGNKQILKLENRLNETKTAERQLRRQGVNVSLATVEADRQGTYGVSLTEIATRSLVVGQYCTGGNLEEHAAAIPDDTQRLNQAMDVFSQMADNCIGISRAGCFFPDMKLPNWLATEENGKTKVVIADTKSFLQTPTGLYNIRRGLPTSTTDMDPPEFNVRGNFSVDKAHVHMLGKDLYQYLTRCDYTVTDGVNDASSLDFSSYPIFNTPLGEKFKHLIENTLRNNALDRLYMDQVRQELDNIHVFALKEQCKELIEQSEAGAMGEDDDLLMEHALLKINELNGLNDVSDLDVLKGQLTEEKEKLEQFQLRFNSVVDLHNKGAHHRVNTRLAINTLYQQVISCPISKRMDPQSTEYKQLEDSLAKLESKIEAERVRASSEILASSIQATKQIKDQFKDISDPSTSSSSPSPGGKRNSDST